MNTSGRRRSEQWTLAEKVAGSRQKILSELRKVIVGQDEVVDEVLMALFCGGHCLITGVPGLAKTLLVRTLSQILDLQLQAHPVHARPDAGRHHRHRDPRRRSRARARCASCKGPIFAHIILADEINRTPPKTQAALLEAMQE